MSWASRAANNLMPLSREQESLAAALREWRYTGNCYDLEEPVEICQLCDHPDIRYQFDIRNLFTGKSLLVGSECINRFGIAATDEEGRTLDAAESRSRVGRDRRKLIDDARKRRVINALVVLANTDEELQISNFIEYLQERGAFTPKQLSLLLWRFDTHRIPHDVKDFKISIRRNREKAQLREMKQRQIKRIWPCLSPSQRKFVRAIE